MKKMKKIWNMFSDLVVIIVMVVVIRSFVFSPYEISGPSMCPYFNAYYNNKCSDGLGEYIIVSKFIYFFKEPSRGDVIIFEKPNSTKGESFIKRIIAIPGETVQLRNGKVYIQDLNGEEFELDESEYLSDINLNNTQPSYGLTEFVVPEDSYFVMGDNRMRSLDSRAHFSTRNPNSKNSNSTAFVPKDNIKGKAWFVIFPFSQARLLESAKF